ncbi:hypothetical protein SD80_005510 [Scytonema tolypothrichoides VB-61278]|nr:hypothetical protein SD80_005510 [Scytonema tolypothrichoides VB-61278]
MRLRRFTLRVRQSPTEGNPPAALVSLRSTRNDILRVICRTSYNLLVKVINECQEELQQGAAVTVEPNRIRIRHLPLLLDV